MPTFFPGFLNPLSTTSGVTFRATGHPYSPTVLNQEMQDLTADLVIPLLWSRHLSILDGIQETFTLFYGDHFDKNGRGFGQKGILDFTFLPLATRKLMADTYLQERKDSYIKNTFAWILALPIKAITLIVALAFTLVLIPLIILITLLRYLCCCCTPENPAVARYNLASNVDTPPSSGHGGYFDNPPPPPPMPMQLPLPLAYTALQVGLQHLERAGIRTQANVQRLLAAPENLALVYVMGQLTYITDNEDRRLTQQEVFDHIYENRAIWTDYRMIEALNENRVPALDQLRLTLAQLQHDAQEVDRIGIEQHLQRQAPSINSAQSTHTASVHQSASTSAKNLYHLHKEMYDGYMPRGQIDSSTVAPLIRAYDVKLIGELTDEQITQSVRDSIERLCRSEHKDPKSQISTELLFHMCYHATTQGQASWREGVTAETAMACFLATLFEIDQEYALTAHGEHTGAQGRMEACEGGAFNKLIAGLAKFHTACEVNYLTPATAALKLPFVVRQTLTAHIKECSAERSFIIQDLQDNGISAFRWQQLKPMIYEQMQQEFAAIYPDIDGQKNPALDALVDAGQDIDLTQYLETMEASTELITTHHMMTTCN